MSQFLSVWFRQKQSNIYYRLGQTNAIWPVSIKCFHNNFFFLIWRWTEDKESFVQHWHCDCMGKKKTGNHGTQVFKMYILLSLRKKLVCPSRMPCLVSGSTAHLITGHETEQTFRRDVGGDLHLSLNPEKGT